jgi:hypothetical protein
VISDLLRGSARQPLGTPTRTILLKTIVMDCTGPAEPAKPKALTLHLLVLRVGLANHPDLALAAHDLATVAHLLDAGANLHDFLFGGPSA